MSNVIQCSPEEAKAIIERMRQSGLRYALEGHAYLTAREADGSVAWKHDQKNIVTDFGRRFFAYGNLVPTYVFTSPSIEPASVSRSAIFDDGNASSSQTSAATFPTYDSVTLTKTWSPAAAFAAPAANRRIGTVGLAVVARSSAIGISGICAYTVLSPVKTQTTTQTLEVVYKVTLTPIY